MLGALVSGLCVGAFEGLDDVGLHDGVLEGDFEGANVRGLDVGDPEGF